MHGERPKRVRAQPIESTLQMTDIHGFVAESNAQIHSSRTRERIAHLNSNDSQFATSKPDPHVVASARRPGLRLPEILETFATGYSARPAVGVRARSTVIDAASGQTIDRTLARYDLLTYKQLWDRVQKLASALTHDDTLSNLVSGDFLATVGFASADYLTIDLLCGYLGLVSVPLQHNASTDQLISIMAETEPRAVATSTEYLDSSVEAALRTSSVNTLIVFDYRAESRAHHADLDRTRERLRTEDRRLTVVTIDELIERGRQLPPAPMYTGGTMDRLALILYTSGSTGSPKGAMYTERMLSLLWLSQMVPNPDVPIFNVTYLPLNHLAGRLSLASTFQAGGVSYFVPKSDLSTVFEDWSLARPTELNLVPRVVDMLHQRYHHDLQNLISQGQSELSARTSALTDIRENVLGGRVIRSIVGTAPLTSEMRRFVEACFEVDLHDGYGLTEIGGVTRDGVIARPPVIDYKLIDVPELGYFTTDKPHARGELLVKSHIAMPGYFKRPDLTAEVFDADGYYRTGDVMAEVAPDELVYVDRRSNVIKLSQGEFVATSRLEAIFGQDPLIEQIFVYGNSERPRLLAVIVPSASAHQQYDSTSPALKTALAESLRDRARSAQLQSYEVPIDFLVEDEPFSTHNGLLSGIGKLSYPKLKNRYRPALETMYASIDASRERQIHKLHAAASQQPTLQTVLEAAQIVLGTPTLPDSNKEFTELGGDSLSAVTFADLLRTSLKMDVDVAEIVVPRRSLHQLSEHLQSRTGDLVRFPSISTIHSDLDTVDASELTLDKFIDAATLAAATEVPAAEKNPKVVLLTGATGYLGRFLCLEWLHRLQDADTTLICLVRGDNVADATQRLQAVFGNDSEASQQYHHLAAKGLEILVGDVTQPHLGMPRTDWDNLCQRVDLIVHAAAFVNHLLPYPQLFGPNVAGTAEIIRLAITHRRKPVTYVSSAAVAYGPPAGAISEDGDIRNEYARRQLDAGYASGYATSKWAGEVLLREAFDLCKLPVRVFRSDLILAHSSFTGQVNTTDAFTRLIISILATGIAPRSFYSSSPTGQSANAHFDGLPADFVASAIAALGSQFSAEFHSYNVVNPHEDGVSLDRIVDWLVQAGEHVRRIDNYHDWYARFETALRGLAEPLRKHSVLALIDSYKQPQPALSGSAVPAELFAASLQQSGSYPTHIPNITLELIAKYPADLRALGLVAPTRQPLHAP